MRVKILCLDPLGLLDCRAPQALPEFVAPGEEKTSGFRKMLANTCQEEYETADEARQIARSLSGEARDDAERVAKQRLLGTIRLISQLLNKAMVNDRIMLLILQDLLGGNDNEPAEENIEV
jgi:hypothetical protein